MEVADYIFHSFAPVDVLSCPLESMFVLVLNDLEISQCV